MYLWIIATVVAYFIKGLCGFANTLVFTTILSFGTPNVNISPIDLLIGYPTNLILTWENRKKLYAGEGFHSYLFQAAYTRCIDYYRKTQSADKYNLHMEGAYLEEYNALLRSDASVLEEIYSKDFYEQLHNLLEKLPTQRREVFILTYIEGLKAKEVSERLQIPQRTVESHIYLAIKYLRAHLSKNDFYILSLLYFFRQ